MLPSRWRLKDKKEFQLVLKKGNRLFGDLVIIRYSKQNKENKCAVIVSTKVSKNAVDRNRVKRLIRENMRKKFLLKMAGVWLVIIAKKDIIDKTFDQIGLELQHLFKVRGLID